MMEKKYQLVAWTKHITDRENARLYVVPSVELELTEPLITEITECRRQEENDRGYISLELARRFIKAYEQSARLEILTGNIDSAIRFLLQAADYCIWEDSCNWAYYDTDLGNYTIFCGKLRHEFETLCEEAIALARKHGLEIVLLEKNPKRTLEHYWDHTQLERDMERYLQ